MVYNQIEVNIFVNLKQAILCKQKLICINLIDAEINFN